MSLKKNVIANYFGSGWTSVMNIVFVPYYIQYLGMEAYGLIGFYAMLQACLTLLDMGMSTTLSREMARFTGGTHTSLSIRDLLRSLEILCFSIAGVYVLGIWLSADWVAQRWLQANQLPAATVAQAFLVMGGVTALRFIEGLYRGAILGLQKQVIFNLATAFMATMRGLGAVAVLAWVQPSIQAYFIWQGVVSIATLAVFIIVVYSNLPAADRSGRFCRQELRKVWRFAGGVMATTFLAIILTQVDKMILSKLLPLEEFGNYSLVVTVSNVLAMLIAPITQAHYPRMTELISQNRLDELGKTFHRGAQLGTVACGAAAMTLFFFGERIIAIWTGNSELAAKVFPLLKIMTCGTLLNSLWHMPYVAQLAYGWSSFAAKVNLIAVIVLIPMMFLATSAYGAFGAAAVWVALNAGYIFISSHFMFRRILGQEKGHWFGHDLFAPILSVAAVVCVFAHWQPALNGKYLELGYITLSGIIAIIAGIAVSCDLRELLLSYLQKKAKDVAVNEA